MENSENFKTFIYFPDADTRGEISFTPVDYSKIELPKEVLDSYASAMVPEIKKFYESDFGKEYFKKWLQKHPEYA